MVRCGAFAACGRASLLSVLASARRSLLGWLEKAGLGLFESLIPNPGLAQTLAPIRDPWPQSASSLLERPLSGLVKKLPLLLFISKQRKPGNFSAQQEDLFQSRWLIVVLDINYLTIVLSQVPGLGPASLRIWGSFNPSVNGP